MRPTTFGPAEVVAENVLGGIRVAIVAMPDAPTAVVRRLNCRRGSRRERRARREGRPEAFDPGQADKVAEALASLYA